MSSNPNNFNDLLQLIRNGEPVSAGVANRSPIALDERTRYLFDLINAAGIGSTVIARQQTVASNVLVGQPVFFNAATNQFEQAIAAVGFDITTSQLTAAASAQVVGIIYNKIDSTLADILLLGYAQVDITAALEAGQTLTAGAYYLSGSTAGALTSVIPPVPVGVLRSFGNGFVFVSPSPAPYGSHTHLHFALKAVPAGTYPDQGEGQPQIITESNVHVEGWLPADDASFNGLAPHDAKYGYNMAANSALQNAWPPLPPTSAVLFQTGVKVPDGLGGLVIFDRNGIWWMSDCYSSTPFPAVATYYESVSESTAPSESANACPYVSEMTLDLYFTQVTFLTDAAVVTSLTTTDPRVQIFCQGGSPTVPATVGSLQLALQLAFVTDAVDPGGLLAIKGFTPATQTFHFGPVATGVYATSDNVVLSGDASAVESVGDVNQTVYYGRVGVSVTTDFNREMFPDLVKLDQASEEYYEDIPYLSFAAGEQQAIRARFPIPQQLDAQNPTFQLNLRLIGFAAGACPALTVTYRRVPLSAGAPTDLPASDSDVTIDTTVITFTDTQGYQDLAATAFTVSPGDDVYVTIQRLSSDAYVGELGLLRMSGVIAAG